jgi:lipopolysaccharide O-acetyltransferase
MGEDFSAEDSLWLLAISRYHNQQFSPKIRIGNQVRISRHVQIAATHFVEIGDNVLIGSGVVITDHNHGQYSEESTPPDIAPSLRPLDHDRRVVIGKNVWLGAGAIVTPDSVIGEGAVIGANSVVIGPIPPFSVAVGLPARVIKTFDFTSQKWVSVK